MDTIVAWEAETPQWPEVLAISRGETLPTLLSTSLLWRIYGPLIGGAGGSSFVIGQSGQSLDGRIATASGHSHYINGPTGLVHLHRLRALVDAVVVGVGTVVADDPQLTVRRVSGPQPARVIIDPNGRAPATAKCFAEDGVRRIVLTGAAKKAPSGVEHIVLADFAPAAIVAALRTAGLTRLLVEGGAMTLSNFLAAGTLDRLHIITGPVIIGSGKPGITLPEIATLKDARRPATATYVIPGGDILTDCDLRK